MKKLDFSFISPYDGTLEAHDLNFYVMISEESMSDTTYSTRFRVYFSFKDGKYLEHRVNSLYEAIEYANEIYNKELEKLCT
jgi:hypothetical protein